MIVRLCHDSTFTIVGLSYAALEDLVSAYDAFPFFSDGDLYDEQDQIAPLRAALSVMPALAESDGHIEPNRSESHPFDQAG